MTTVPAERRGRPSSIVRKLVTALCVIVGFAVGAHLLLFFLQGAFIYHPEKMTTAEDRAFVLAHPGAASLTMTTTDNVMLRGWWITPPSTPNDTVILYFGGKRSEISRTMANIAARTGRQVVGVNYRGFGLSGGQPSEQALYTDALALYEMVRAHKVPARNIVLCGRSLGSGVAVYLAQHRPVAAVMLATPYENMDSLARERFPFLLTGLVVRQHFDSLRRAPAIHVPLLALIAERDAVIPPRHAQRLLAAWGGPTTAYTIAGVGHDGIYTPAYWQQLTAFLDKIELNGVRLPLRPSARAAAVSCSRSATPAGGSNISPGCPGSSPSPRPPAAARRALPSIIPPC